MVMLWRPNSTNSFTPPCDVLELENKIVILVEIAGMAEKDFKINLANQRLVISGVRSRPIFESQAHHRVEIGYGEFRLVVPLQWTVVGEQVTATYRDGFLQIELPRKGEKRIAIVNVNNKQDEEADGE